MRSLDSYGRVCRTIGLLVVFRAGVALAQEEPRAPKASAPVGGVALNQLPALFADHNLRPRPGGRGMALVGVHPDRNALPADGIRILATIGGRGVSSKADTNAVSWLHSAFHGLGIVCVPLADGAGIAAVAEAIATALRSRPAVMYVRADALAGPSAEVFPALNEAIVDCWRGDCLAFTVLGESQGTLTPIGILGVHLVDSRPSNEGRDGGRSRTLPLALARRLLRDGPLDFETDGGATLAAAAYLAASLTLLPTEAPVGHLDRAARIALTGPPARPSSRPAEVYREVDLARALDPEGTRFDFGGQHFAWADRIGQLDLDKLIEDPEEGILDPEKRRRVVLAPLGMVRVRWLAAASILTGGEPVMFIPSPEQGLVALRPGKGRDSNTALEMMRRLFATRSKSSAAPPSHCLFNTVIRVP